jgi:hypothetical protein
MSTFSNLKFELIGTGEQSGTWGTTTNTNIGTAIEQALVGMATLATGDFTSNVATLSLSDTNALQDARALCLNITATLSAAGTINVPAIEKPYIVINNSVGGYAVTVKVSGQTGISVPNGKRTVVYNNGTDVGSQINYLPTLALGDVTGTIVGTTATQTLTNKTITFADNTLTGVAGTGASNTFSNSNTFSGTNTFSGANTFTARQTFSGSTSALAGLLTNAAEVVTVSATAATGTIAYYATTQSVLYYTSNASANWVVNLTGASTPTTLNTLLSTGQCITLVFMATNGSTAYYNTSVQVDGTTSGVTTKWASGLAPSSGNANSIEAYTYTVIKTGSATFTVLATRSQFA